VALDNLATTEAAAQADTQLAQLQHVDRVLQNEAGGILEIVVSRARETAALCREIERGDVQWSRRLAILNGLLPRFLASMDDRHCIGCSQSFSRAFLPVDFVTAHARGAGTAGILGGVCGTCSAQYDARGLRERFCAVLAEWYPDLRQVDPASLSSPSGRA
jgi:hypothetical protein